MWPRDHVYRQWGPWLMPRMYCSLKAYCTTLSPPSVLVVPTFAARCLHAYNNARDPSSERWNYVGKRVPEFWLNDDFHAIWGTFTCRNSKTWDRRLYFPSEGRHVEDFFALKNPDDFGRVWTRERGYLKAAHYP